MKIERSNLNNRIDRAMSEMKLNDKYVFEFKGKMKDLGFSPGQIIAILNKSMPTEVMPDDMIFAIASIIENITRFSYIDVYELFTEVERRQYHNYSYEPQEAQFPIEIKNVLKRPNEDNHYTTYISGQQLHEWYNNGLISYNFETQRQKKSKYQNNVLFEGIDVNATSVNQIAEKVKSGDYKCNYITLNILKNGEESFEYDKENNTLTIKHGKIDVIDGFHRSLGILRAMQDSHETLDFWIGITFTHYTIKMAQDFIAQEDKRNKIKKDQIKAFEANFENAIIDKIKDNSDELKGKIVTNSEMLKTKNGWVTRDILERAIKYNFQYRTKRQANRVGDFIAEGLDEIIGYWKEKYQSDSEIMQNTYCYDNNAFVIYIAALSMVYEEAGWKYKLDDMLEKLNLNRGNPFWTHLEIEKVKLSNKNVKDLTHGIKPKPPTRQELKEIKERGDDKNTFIKVSLNN